MINVFVSVAHSLFRCRSLALCCVVAQVMAEVYDEFVFVHPTVEWFQVLHSGPVRRVEAHPLMSHFATPEFANNEAAHLHKLNNALAIVQSKIDEERIKLFIVDKEISKLTDAV